jgi:hypothetical protein
MNKRKEVSTVDKSKQIINFTFFYQSGKIILLFENPPKEGEINGKEDARKMPIEFDPNFDLNDDEKAQKNSKEDLLDCNKM